MFQITGITKNRNKITQLVETFDEVVIVARNLRKIDVKLIDIKLV